MIGDLWEVRSLPDGLTLDLCGGNRPALVLRQGEAAIRVELRNVKALIGLDLSLPTYLW